MNSRSARIKQLRKDLKLSQDAVAEAVGISQPAYSKIEKGDDTVHWVALARVLKTTPEYLQFGATAEVKGNSTTAPRPIKPFDNADELDDGQYVFVPSIQISLSAGTGSTLWEVCKGKPRAFDRSFIEREGIDPTCAATMVVSGESMSPTLRDGWSVLVDYCRRPVRDGKIYAFVWQGEYFIKRLFKRPGGSLVMVSDNPDKVRYPDREIDLAHMEELSIIGVVEHIVGGRL